MLWLARAVRTHSRMITMVCSWPWAARPIRTVGDQCDERHAAAPRSPPACSGDQRARAWWQYNAAIREAPETELRRCNASWPDRSSSWSLYVMHAWTMSQWWSPVRRTTWINGHGDHVLRRPRHCPRRRNTVACTLQQRVRRGLVGCSSPAKCSNCAHALAWSIKWQVEMLEGF